MLSHQYCSNGTIEVELGVLIEAGVEIAYVILADGALDDAKWAAESRKKKGQHELHHWGADTYNLSNQ